MKQTFVTLRLLNSYKYCLNPQRQDGIFEKFRSKRFDYIHLFLQTESLFSQLAEYIAKECALTLGP